MKKRCIFFLGMLALIASSCGSGSDSNSAPPKDTTATNSYDSAANNGILPPSGAPGNAGNSSVADTTYHAGDSSKKK